MKYFLRSVKYLITLVIFLAVFIAIMVLFSKNMSFSQIFDPEVGLFRANQGWKMLGFLAVFAAIYPLISFIKKDVTFNGSFADKKAAIMEIFVNQGYVPISEDSDNIIFRKAKKGARLSRMFEDKVILTKGDSIVTLDGYRKDIYRLASGIEYAISREDNN